MTAIKKRGKEVISDFEEKLTLCSKWDKLDQVLELGAHWYFLLV